MYTCSDDDGGGDDDDDGHDDHDDDHGGFSDKLLRTSDAAEEYFLHDLNREKKTLSGRSTISLLSSMVSIVLLHRPALHCDVREWFINGSLALLDTL